MFPFSHTTKQVTFPSWLDDPYLSPVIQAANEFRYLAKSKDSVTLVVSIIWSRLLLVSISFTV